MINTQSFIKNSVTLPNDGRPLHLWSVSLAQPTQRAVLFLHGSTLSGLVFDIPIQGLSWQERLAADGFATYALDNLGFGRSYKPASDTEQPIARAAEAYQDALTAVKALREAGMTDITIIGSSWGTIVAGMLVSHYPDVVERLVQYAPIYNERNSDWLKLLQEEGNPDQIAPVFNSAYRVTSAAALMTRWSSDIPIPNKSDWRDESVAQTVLSRTLAVGSDTFQTPNGPFHDLLQAFSGTSLYDAARIHIPLCIVRPDADSTSQHGDGLALFNQAVSTEKYYENLPNGSHFMFLEKSAPILFNRVRAFLD